MRTFGTVKLAKDTWIVDADPHVAIRLKRVFGKIHKKAVGKVKLPCTEEVCRELEWFMDRFPLRIEADDEAILRQRGATFRERIARLEDLIDPNYKPRSIELALPAREYQLVAAEILLTRGFLLLGDDVGLGKAQPLDAKVLTPEGWRRMADLAVGDAIVDPDGGVGEVTGIFPQGTRQVFRVELADGAATECCDEHLWLVQTANDRIRGGGRVLALRDFRDKLVSIRGNGQRAHNYFVPTCAPVERPAAEFPFDPYALGLLLGDGSFRGSSIRFTSPDEELVERLRREVVRFGVRLVAAGSRPLDWRVGIPSGRNILPWMFRKLGLWGKDACAKEIPDRYFGGSIDQRLALLRGLMDTDGDCTCSSVAVFSTSSPFLRDGVVRLVRELGGFTKVYKRDAPTYSYRGERRTGRPSYRVNVRLPVNPFTLPRKAARWRPPLMARAISSVEPVGEKPVQCIRVSTKRSLYVTDDYVVTHNTVSAICALRDARALPAIVVTLSGIMPRQWEREINRFAPDLFVHVAKKGTAYELPTWMGRGPDVVVMNYHKLAGWADVLKHYARTVIFDEAQELRRSESQKSQAAREIASHMAYRLGLSATPIYNFGGEIFNVLQAIAPGEIGTKTEFTTEWCDHTGKKIANPAAFGSYLRESFIMLRRTRKDVGRELPALSRFTHPVDSDPAALDRVKDSAAELARIILRTDAGARGEKMQAAEELSNVLRQATGIAKAPYVGDFVRILVENGERVLVYAWHREVYSILLAKLEDLQPAMFTGSETPAQKDAERERFVKGETPVMLMSLRAGAGVDGLQKVCRTVVFAELDWSPGVHEQAIGRVYRDGQGEPVAVYFLVAEDGADPVISEVLGLKREQVEGVRNAAAPELEKLQTAGDHVRKLAEAYLGGRKAPRREMQEAAS